MLYWCKQGKEFKLESEKLVFLNITNTHSFP